MSEDALEQALRPLRFAARRDFANLHVVQDLEQTLQRALERADLSPPWAALGARILGHLEGVDDLQGAEKRSRVEAALRAAEAGVGEAEPAKSGVSARSSQGGLGSNPTTTPRREREVAASGTESDSGARPTPALPPARALFAAAPRLAPVTPPKRRPMHEAEPAHALVSVVGVGPKTAEKMAAKGILTVQDALFYLPVRYEDRSRILTISELRPGIRAQVQGVIAASALRYAGRKRLWEMAIRDGTGVLSCRFFRFSKRDMEGRFPVGTRVRAFGAVTFFGAQRQMAHPDLEVLTGEEVPDTGVVKPVYPEVDGVAPRSLQRVLQSLAEVAAKRVFDPIPEAWRARLHLAPLAPAVRAAHLPEDAEAQALAALRRRLAFDELFYLQLALGLGRADRESRAGLAQTVGDGWRVHADKALPFEPTGAQARVLDEIEQDLARPNPMSRLVQGDVGSGKTAVALLSAATVALGARRQTCLLAPTEILAEQHGRGAQALFSRLGLQTALLSGSTPGKARLALLRALKRGDVDLLVGTHAVLEPDVEFKDLGLVIIDEQHRFGVEQRARLLAKREEVPPDVLVMTATPIPRTLSLSLYGDLRVSVIDELPPGRSPTDTRVFAARDAARAHAEVKGALDEGRQAYIVFPLVEASDQLELKAATEAVEELRALFAPHEVALLHGKMKSDEKQAVMRRFAHGEVGVLVATTVIEVGVDVPNATVMVVEEADRFGLSQLHQLRGRVGRGQYPGTCLLIAGRSAGSEASERLAVMAETTDGFVIAERDLEIRGPGEILGTRQSGLPDLALADLVHDGRLLEEARAASEALIAEDPSLEAPEHQALRAELERRFAGKLARIGAG